MSRRLAREFAMQLVYQMEAQKDEREEQLETALLHSERTFAKRDVDYIKDVSLGVFNHIADIDRIIGENARGWKLSRLSRVDLAILRLCIYELNCRTDIPTNVSINEAVELAKRYGAEETGAFVNGVLAKAAQAADSGARDEKRDEALTEELAEELVRELAEEQIESLPAVVGEPSAVMEPAAVAGEFTAVEERAAARVGEV